MDQSSENSVGIVDTQISSFTGDSNMNEKTMNTQYIYTPDGQLIPTGSDNTIEGINPQHYSSEAQSIQIEQIDYQYHDSTSTTISVNQTEFVESSNNFIIQDSVFESAQETYTAAESTVNKKTDEITTNSTTYVYPATSDAPETYMPEQVQKSEVENNKKDENAEKISTTEPDDKVVNEEAAENVATEAKKSAEITKPIIQEIKLVEADIESLKENPAVEIETQEVDSSEVPEADDAKNDESVVVENSNLTDDDDDDDENLEDELDDDMIPVESLKDYEENDTSGAKVSKPRGRKPKTDIPLHILGHDVNKPVEVYVNGRTPKPRLGVKVPYRNLTSQIVSKTDIENEIISRGKRKQDIKKSPISVRQLSSRLAQKISLKSSESISPIFTAEKDKSNESAASSEKTVVSEGIGNDSDLLAILEGDDKSEDVPESSKSSEAKESPDEETLKNLEKKIALQQLEDLPYLAPKTRYIRGGIKTVVQKIEEPFSPVVTKTPKKKNKSRRISLEVETVVTPMKVNVGLKTYSRKRRSSELSQEILTPSKRSNSEASTSDNDAKPSSSTNGSSTKTNRTYVTKSSRIIKRKVIWDPDEQSLKGKSPENKSESLTSQKKTLQKSSTQSKNELRSVEFDKNSADLKGKNEKKVEEKSSSNNNKKKESPIPVKLTPKIRTKGKTEVDRLLQDEGAIKMLYELRKSENNGHDENKPSSSKKSKFSPKKSFKDLAKKANQIKTDLVMNTSASSESTKLLRKKDNNNISINNSPAIVVATAASSPIKKSAQNPLKRHKSKESSTRSRSPSLSAFSYSNEVSYLIRRRSSSSISSGAENSSSMDIEDSEDKTPKLKSTNTDAPAIKKPKKVSGSEKSDKSSEIRLGKYKTFNFSKSNKCITIRLHHSEDTTKGYFTIELLNELTTILSNIATKEKKCNAVLIRSAKIGVFSHGLDYKYLINNDENQRNELAKNLAKSVKNFLKCLLNFPKILLAAIQGECVGLAVTMLPLFDLIIASDDAKFLTHYNKYGAVAEAGFLLSVPFISNSGLAAELFYTSTSITADEAHRRGLISKLCWSEKYEETIKTTIQAIAQGSKQSFESTKALLRVEVKNKVNELIENMDELLVKHWISNICQSKFSNIE